MTKILARKKNGKKCQSVTGFKNVEGALSKHLKVGFVKCIIKEGEAWKINAGEKQ